MTAPIRHRRTLLPLLACAALAAAGASLSACNTSGGAGQDISSAGHDVTRAATSVQGDIHRATGAATQ